MDGGNRWWWIGTAAMLLLALVLVIAAPRDGDGPAGTLLSPVPEGRAASTAPGASRAQVRAKLRRHARDGGRLVDGDVLGRVTALRGVPVVVNQWASWCPPCAAEFPFFARLARRYATRVAFLGLNSSDRAAGDAGDFLREHPVIYPSVVDRSAEQARGIGAGTSWPTTVFFDRAGHKTFVKQGGYATQALLERDLRRYALGAGGS